jgi:hypothetical protein
LQFERNQTPLSANCHANFLPFISMSANQRP